MYKILICSNEASKEEDLANIEKVMKVTDKTILKDKVIFKGILSCELLSTLPVISGATMLQIGEEDELFAVTRGFNDRHGNPCCRDFYISDDLDKIEKCLPLQGVIQKYLEQHPIASKPYPAHMTAYGIIGTFLNEFISIDGNMDYIEDSLNFIGLNQ